MRGLSSHGKDSLNKIIEDIFDRIALQFIGDIPKLRNKKRLVISYQPNFGLSHLFVQAMHNHAPNPVEQDVLRGILDSAHGYIESLKNRTKSSITERIDALAREATLQKRKVSNEDVHQVINEEMKRARNHLKTIAEAESTKFRNLGKMLDISRVASSVGDEDPTVFFTVVRDNVTCKECIKLHLMPDGVTPRLWKLSELKQGYHKRGETNPSISGLHPHCRCFLTYLTRGFGFDKNGKLKYQSEDFDAFSNQRE